MKPTIEIIFDCLRNRALTRPQLMALTGLCDSTVKRYTRELHAAKRIWICGYEVDEEGDYFHVKPQRIYKRGHAPDAPRPAPKGRQAAMQKWRSKHKTLEALKQRIRRGQTLNPYAQLILRTS
jgi:hypothetical protein